MTDGGTPRAQPELAKLLSSNKNQLLLLGLDLLNKGLKLPCAVVKPQVKAPVPKAEIPEKLKAALTTPVSPRQHEVAALLEDKAGSRKRKRDPADDLGEVERREKRFVSCRFNGGFEMLALYIGR